MPRRVADDASHAARRRVAINSWRRLQFARRIRPHAGVIVVEDKDRTVIRIPLAADAQVPRAEVAAFDVLGYRLRGYRGALTLPRPILSVRGHDHPLLPEGVPSLLPSRGHHSMFVPLLHMSAISKRFPGVVALDSVDFVLAAGEIVALVGENGAGKSTLMKILAGIIRADSGAIHIDGTPVTMPGPGDAARLGIAVIHQERELIDTLDVAGNVFLGREPTRGGRLRLLDRRRMHAETQQQLARIGVQIPARTPLRDLSAAQQQLVSIVRAISMNARMLILDEPTSSLTSTDAERLFDVLRDLRRSGTAIVYISHRLKEIEILADRAVVLRDGRNAGTLARDAISHDRLVQLMVGRVVDRASPRVEASAGPAVLRIERLRTGRYPDAEISLDIHRAEVLGIAGLVGAGRTELAEAICGVGPRRSGDIVLDGRPLAIHRSEEHTSELQSQS